MAHKLSSLLVTCVFALAFGLASADEPERIVGGLEADLGEFPYIASLRIGGFHFCAGAIISEYHILTAAHCLEDYTESVEGLTVVTGTNHILKGGVSHRVERVFSHPRYSPRVDWYYDIGVIKLADPIVFDARQKKVELPKRDPPRFIQAIASGWGDTAAPPRGRSPSMLQKLVLNLLSTAACQSYLRYKIYDNMICTFNAVDMGTCSGDSGGPLVHENEILGVVSGGIPCARGYPDVFTNVWSMRDFILDAMSK